MHAELTIVNPKHQMLTKMLRKLHIRVGEAYVSLMLREEDAVARHVS